MTTSMLISNGAEEVKPKSLSCSKCGWSNVRSSHSAGFWDTLASFVLLQPFRCRKCRLRFYRFRRPIDQAASHRRHGSHRTPAPLAGAVGHRA
jgi:hypothetical protein